MAIGDIVHNLRSALDHLVWALTVANGNTPPAVISKGKEGKKWRDIKFPIHPTPYPTNDRKQLIPWSQSEVPNSLWGIQPSLRADFEKLQPFGWGKDADIHPLTVLHDLWNVDKHRHLNLAVFSVGYKSLFGSSPTLPIPGWVNRLNFALNPKRSFEGRTEFGRLSWDGGPVPPEMAHPTP